MKKLITVIIFIGIAFFFTVSPAMAGLFGDIVDQANKHIAKNEYTNAKQLLYQAKLEERNNPKIMYKAGLAYYSMGDTANADQCFNNVLHSNSTKYKNFVAQHYYDQGQSAFNSKRFKSAKYNFRKFLAFAPKEAKETVSRIYGEGIKAWNVNDRKTAYQVFRLARNLDSMSGNIAHVNDQISDLYFNACSASSKPCLNFLARAHEFSTKHDKEGITMVVAIANAGNIPEKHRTELRNFLTIYNLSKATRNKLIPPPPPDWQNLKNKYTMVEITNGKPSPKYYRLPYPGYPFFVKFNKEKSSHFYLLSRGGTKITSEQIASGHVYFTEQDFKIVPTKKKRLRILIQLAKQL